MQRFRVFMIAFVLGLGLHAAEQPTSIPAAKIREAKPALERLLEACINGDTGEIAQARSSVLEVLGPYAGLPERARQRVEPIDTATPDLTLVRNAWRQTLAYTDGKYPWQHEAASARPRATGRWLRALCQTMDAAPGQLALIQAAGAHLVASQARNGVFGFPYAEGHGGSQAANVSKLVTAAQDRGINILEKGRIVDDLGTGGLNFDNGEAAYAMFEAARATTNELWRAAALRAADWAIERPLVANWNYNSFNAWIAARAFRETGRTNYLSAALRIMDTGVWPGQMDDGTWMDAHNAQPQYRAVMIRAGLELVAALRQAGRPEAATAEKRTRLALDSLARHTLAWGFDRDKAWESLTIDAFATGLATLGENELWRKALNVEINGVTKQAPRKGPLPESVGSYLLISSTR